MANSAISIAMFKSYVKLPESIASAAVVRPGFWPETSTKTARLQGVLGSGRPLFSSSSDRQAVRSGVVFTMGFSFW
jgi:hypothetical protein